MVKIKGQMIPPEIRDRYNRILQTSSNNVVSTRQQRSPLPSPKQKKLQENFIRCTLYWNNLNESEKAEIYNLAQNKGMRYFNYFMTEVLKKRHQGEIADYGLKTETYPAPCSSPGGITKINDNIIIADIQESKLYQLNENMQVINIIEMQNILPQNITSFKNFLWIANNEKIYQIDMTGQIINQHNLPNRQIQAITANTRGLICYDSINQEIISYVPSNKEITVLYNLNENKENIVHDLGFDGVYIWVSTSKPIKDNEQNFNIEEYLPNNNHNFNLEEVSQRKFSLKRLNPNKDNYELSIKELNLSLSHFCFQNDQILATDSISRLIYKIKVVAELP